MKNTAIAMMTLVLIGTAWGQERRRAPRQIGNPIGLGGTVTAGVKNRKPMNLGDTATHEVVAKGKHKTMNLGDTGTHEIGHKGKRQPMNLGDTATHEVVAQGKRRTQNLMPYVKQDNVHKTTPRRTSKRNR
jgi:hypothetical protein